MKRMIQAAVMVAILGMLLLSSCASRKKGKAWTSSAQPLREMEILRTKIKEPKFAANDFLITDFGAVGDGQTKNTAAFKKAIEACNQQGGGRVVVPLGTFLTGAIHLKSNVNLHLVDNAKILFSRDANDYLPMVFTRWEGMECMNYSPFIYAYGQENIAITGKGILDGNADNDNWWYWCGAKKFGWKDGLGRQNPARDSLHTLNHQKTDPKTRIFGPGYFLRPNFVQPYHCKNVLISGIKMVNSPMWNINPVLCENVTVTGVKVITHGPNNDGCDPESCKNVLISNCYFDTGDDCIAIKSGRDEDGRRIGRPAENHIIEHCEMRDGHGGVVIGSEISGGARNIYAINCTMDSKDLDRVLRIKTSSSRGGTTENVFMKDIKVGTYGEALVKCNMFYEKAGNFIPTIRNIWVENVSVEKGGKYALMVNAYKESPVENLRMINCDIKGVKVPLNVDHVKGLVFENVKVNGEILSVPDSLK